MRDRRTVLDHQYALAPYDRGIVQLKGHRRLDEMSIRIGGHDRPADRFDVGGLGRIHLRDHNHVGSEQIDFSGKVAAFVADTMGIDEDDFQIRLEKGDVIIASIP